jgi:hypothetical protein
VPFIFVSGYDHSILPADLAGETVVSKPVYLQELSRITAEHFSPGLASEPSFADRTKRIEALQQRIITGERRVATQHRRIQKLQFEGHDPFSIQIAADLLGQMQVSLNLLRQTLTVFENMDRVSPAAAAARVVTRPINDDIVDRDDPKSVLYWADKLGTTPAHLTELLVNHHPSAHVIARALDLETNTGPSRKSTVLL